MNEVEKLFYEAWTMGKKAVSEDGKCEVELVKNRTENNSPRFVIKYVKIKFKFKEPIKVVLPFELFLDNNGEVDETKVRILSESVLICKITAVICSSAV